MVYHSKHISIFKVLLKHLLNEVFLHHKGWVPIICADLGDHLNKRNFVESIVVGEVKTEDQLQLVLNKTSKMLTNFRNFDNKLHKSNWNDLVIITNSLLNHLNDLLYEVWFLVGVK